MNNEYWTSGREESWLVKDKKGGVVGRLAIKPNWDWDDMLDLLHEHFGLPNADYDVSSTSFEEDYYIANVDTNEIIYTLKFIGKE